MSRVLREIAAPFVAAAPAGARVRTRLRVSPRDAEVLRAVGRHLGMLAGRDLAARCAEGGLDARGRAESRRERKRALTAESSSRWAGAITRTNEDACQLAGRNLAAERGTLAARVRKIRGPARRSRRDQIRAPCRVRDPRRAARQDDPAEGAEGTPGPRRAADRSRGRAGDAGRPAADARPPQPGGRRADRGRVAGAVGRRTAFPDRRRGEGQSARKRDAAVEPGRGLVRGQAARPARAPRQPPARSLPAVLRGRLLRTGATKSPRRPRRARCGTTSPATRSRTGGTSTRHGRPPRARPRPCASLTAAPVVAVDVNAGHLAVAVARPGRERHRHAVHHSAGTGRAARDCPRRARSRRRLRPDRRRQGTRRAGRCDRRPRLRRSPLRGT